MEDIVSKGVCVFCKKTYTKTGFSRHLQKHLEAEEKEGKPGKSYLLKVTLPAMWGDQPYFLFLWMNGEAKMKSLDDFLRDIWLECCGHLSSFHNARKRRNDEIPMSIKAKMVFLKGKKMMYTYDFGSTTELEISVLGAYHVKSPKKIILLSRNEPFYMPCSICGKKNATQICMQCCYEEEATFCDTCAEAHSETCEDFEDYGAMPIVNSPRTGICGYEGGSIDQERDVYVTKV